MKKTIIGFISVLLILCIGYFLSPLFLQKFLFYQKPNINDYQIFSNRTVEAGNYIPWDSAIDYNKKQFQTETLKKIDSMKPIAFLIVQRGKLKYEHYWENYSKDSLSNSFSMVKSIISLLIGIAIDDSLIQSVNQPVGDFIDEFSHGENAQLTIKHLLTMSSGLNWEEQKSGLVSVEPEAYFCEDLKKLIGELKVTATPGVKYKHQNGDTQLLAMILEKASGMTVSEYASLKLWKPIGAEHPALWSLDNKAGIEKAFCCFNSNARDFARIGQLILNSGMYDDIQVVSKNYLDSATTPASYLTDNQGQSVYFYGYQFWLTKYQAYKVIFARGELGQYIFVIPGKNAVVVRLGYKEDEKNSINTEMPDDIYLYLKAAMEILD